MTEVALTDLGTQIFGVSTLVRASLLFNRPSETLYKCLNVLQNIEQMHRDHVPAVPPTFHLLGSTPIAHNQGMLRLFSAPDAAVSAPTSIDPADVHILTLQGHPEFTAPISEAIIEVREGTGVLDKATADGARARMGWRNDGVRVVGRAVWRVLGV